MSDNRESRQSEFARRIAGVAADAVERLSANASRQRWKDAFREDAEGKTPRADLHTSLRNAAEEALRHGEKELYDALDELRSEVDGWHE